MAQSAKSKAASLLGRLGRAKLLKKLRSMPPEELSERMRRVANKRWHPDEKGEKAN